MLSTADKKTLLLQVEQTIDRIDELIYDELSDRAYLVSELEKDARSFLSTFRWFLHENGETLEYKHCEALVRLVLSELNERLLRLKR